MISSPSPASPPMSSTCWATRPPGSITSVPSTVARPEARGVGPAAEQQPETGDDHRLARAGLTGDHVEARRKLQHGFVDDTEPLDADLLDPWSHCPLPSLAKLRQPRRGPNTCAH